MLDIHSHIIYGIDDGAKTIDDSIALLKQAKEVGIHHIIATPHYNDFINDDFFKLRDERCAELNEISKNEKIDVTIEAAVEVAFLSDWDKILDNEKCFIRGKYILVEFPDYDMPEDSLDTIFRIRRKGLIPIIAHPERCVKIQKSMLLAKELIRLGSHLQCDAGSLLGQFGANTKKAAEKLLKMNYYRLLGSDAHELKYRNYSILNEIADRERFENDKLQSDELISEVDLSLEEKSVFLEDTLSKLREWIKK